MRGAKGRLHTLRPIPCLSSNRKRSLDIVSRTGKDHISLLYPYHPPTNDPALSYSFTRQRIKEDTI